jgi:transposase
MAKKRLSLEDIQQMKSMVQKGVAPEDIAKHFNIAISSVHNYKKRFKTEGINFPNVRGKRPTGSVNMENKTPVASVNTTEVKEQVSTTMQSGMNFVVNGVPVQVSAEAKNVNITKNSIEVKF